METVEEYIKSKITEDIVNMADEVAIILDAANESNITPKEELDIFISFASSQNVDFWEVLKENCSLYEYKRLYHIWEGKDIKDFKVV